MAVIGIDLGTTNSLAAYWKDNEPHLIPNQMGSYSMPSAVSYVEEQDKVVVGSLAKKRRITHGEMTQTSFKRFMGTKKEWYLGKESYSACELSALVLGKIKAEAEQYLQEEITDAIVTVPAYFNAKQRMDTKKAALLAGLPVSRLINEPSAAALAYRRQGKQDNATLLVFDFGGGTLDLSLVECFEDVVEILGVTGDNHLGGDDIDLAIAQWFCRQKHWEEADFSPNQWQLLLKQSEQAKCALSNTDRVLLSFGGEQAELSGDLLFEICLPLFSKIKVLFLRLLKDCGFTVSELEDIVLVGGSSKLPVLHRFLRELLGREPKLLADPDYVVALGAGVYAGIRERKEEIRDLVLTDVCPFTLGVGSVHGEDDREQHLTPIIERNATLPARKTKGFVSVQDYQRSILFRIFQGEEYRAEENVLLGTLEIEIPPCPAGKAQVILQFTYDLNGILQVEAVNDKGTTQKLLISDLDLTEAEQTEAWEKLQQMLFAEEKKLQIQMQKQRAEAYYEQAVGRNREWIASLLGWYENELNSGRWYRQKRALARMEEMLDGMEQQEADLEQVLFDGELWQEDYESEEEPTKEEALDDRDQGDL